MSNLFWLTDAQMARLQAFFLKSHGKPRIVDRRVLSGEIFFQSQLLEVVRRAAGVWPAENPLQALEALEAVEREGGVRPDDGWSGCRGCRSKSNVRLKKFKAIVVSRVERLLSAQIVNAASASLTNRSSGPTVL